MLFRSDGSSTISLRGLGADRTLILVDGHRVLRGDVNSIPAAMIQRIEVLTAGASATYGSDAIGGVVNFITKKNYHGVQVTANYGESSRKDGKSHGYTLTLGNSSDKGGFVAGIGYSKIEGIQADQRAFSENSVSIGGAPGALETYIGGSASSPYGDIGIPVPDPKGPPLSAQAQKVYTAWKGCVDSGSGRLARNPDATGMNPITDYHCYQLAGAASDKYNYASTNLIMTPQQRTNGFVLSHYNINDNVQVYFNAYFNKTRSNFQLAPAVYGSPYGANISADNYYNPFGTEFSSSGSLFLARLSAIGPRFADYSNTLFQGTAGVKGHFTISDRRWDWDVGMDYGHNTRIITTGGLPNMNKLYTGPSYMGSDGVVHCGVAGSSSNPTNCDASFNPFNLQSPNSVAALQNSAVPALTNRYSQMKEFYANANGGLVDLPAGTMRLAVGLSYRKQHMATRVDPVLTVDPATGTCVLGSQCSAGMRGGYNVKEA